MLHLRFLIVEPFHAGIQMRYCKYHILQRANCVLFRKLAGRGRIYALFTFTSVERHGRACLLMFIAFRIKMRAIPSEVAGPAPPETRVKIQSHRIGLSCKPVDEGAPVLGVAIGLCCLRVRCSAVGCRK